MFNRGIKKDDDLTMMTTLSTCPAHSHGEDGARSDLQIRVVRQFGEEIDHLERGSMRKTLWEILARIGSGYRPEEVTGRAPAEPLPTRQEPGKE